MRVFVHMNYGNADVYNAETDEDLAFIYDTLYKMLEDFGEELDRHLRPTERYVLELIDQFGGYNVHESVEFGTGFTNTIKR